MKNYFSIIGIGLLIFTTLFLYQQNRMLKMDIASKNNEILSQNETLKNFNQKSQANLLNIEQKQSEIEKIKKLRAENEKKFHQNSSEKYYQWRSDKLPFDVVKRLCKEQRD